MKAQTTANNKGLISSDMVPYKVASYELWWTVRAVKQWYKDRVEASLGDWDSSRMWQGLVCKKSNSNNNDHQVALTSMEMKCFERLNKG